MRYCDTCIHFPKPDDPLWHKCAWGYIHCTLGRLMRFSYPKFEDDPDCGFYNKGCRFFEKSEEAE